VSLSDFYGEFSPVIKYGLPDYKRDSSKWFDWVDEQEHYCLNGFTHGSLTVPGRLYFKLNFFHILHLGDDAYETLISPYLVDAQVDFYKLVDQNVKTGRDIIVGKGRDKGFSYDIANIALYETHFHDFNSVLTLFPGGKSKAKIKFREKYDLAWNNLIDDFKFYPDLMDTKDVLKYGWEERDEETGKKKVYGPQSSLTMLEVVSADVAKSGRYKFVLIEEFGEITNPLNLIVTNRANMQKGAKKFGITIGGGTSNAFNEGYKDFQELWYNHEKYGFDKFFIPAQKAYWGFVDYRTGSSDEDGALDDIMKKRDGLTGEKLMIEMQNYPTTEAEMFMQNKVSPFDAVLVSSQVHRIKTDKTIQKAIQRGNLYMVGEGADRRVEFIMDNNNGRWYKFLGPNSDLVRPDVGGVDSYRLANVSESDSKGAIVIYRPNQGVSKIGNLPVCVYHHRPSKKEAFFQDVLMTAIYYNCKMLIEYTDEDIFTFMRDNGGLKFMRQRPKLIDSPYSSSTYQYGIKPTEGNKGTALEYGVEDFNHHYDNHVFEQLLEEFLKFGVANTDLADAYNWAVLHSIDDNKYYTGKQQKQKERKFMPYTVVDKNGQIVVVNSPQKAIQHEKRWQR
jgi:hypothetical protein